MTIVRYIVRFIDSQTGIYIFKCFDYRNDAQEFMNLKTTRNSELFVLEPKEEKTKG